jgi:iron complex transport system permease protein
MPGVVPSSGDRLRTQRPRRWRRLGILLFVCLVGSVLALSFGHVFFGPGEVLSALAGKGSPAAIAIIQELRGPRVLVGALVGGALGIAGVLVQALLRNPLADPGLLGAEHGAGLGVLLLVFFAPEATASPWAMPAVSIGGAALALLLVLALASARRGGGPLRLVLVGMGVSLVLGALMTMFAVLIPELLYESLLCWFAGTLTKASLGGASALGATLAVALPWVLRLASQMDLLAFGDDVPLALGVSLRGLRLQLAIWSVLLAGCAWAAAGGIPFVGLLAPHIGRRLVGSAHATLLPAAGVIGAILVVLADAVGRVCAPPTEVPAGILVALIGGPFFAVLLLHTVRLRPS